MDNIRDIVLSETTSKTSQKISRYTTTRKYNQPKNSRNQKEYEYRDHSKKNCYVSF